MKKSTIDIQDEIDQMDSYDMRQYRKQIKKELMMKYKDKFDTRQIKIKAAPQFFSKNSQQRMDRYIDERLQSKAMLNSSNTVTEAVNALTRDYSRKSLKSSSKPTRVQSGFVIY